MSFSFFKLLYTNAGLAWFVLVYTYLILFCFFLPNATSPKLLGRETSTVYLVTVTGNATGGDTGQGFPSHINFVSVSLKISSGLRLLSKEHYAVLSPNH